jgi:hypothetical protein
MVLAGVSGLLKLWSFGGVTVAQNWGKEKLPVAARTSHRLDGTESKLSSVIYTDEIATK